MAKRKKGGRVVRFRVLSDEHLRVERLAVWREKRDVSEYLRWLVEREWREYSAESSAVA